MVYSTLRRTDKNVKSISGPVCLIAFQHWNILDDNRRPTGRCKPKHTNQRKFTTHE
jgi:hypothetical protein